MFFILLCNHPFTEWDVLCNCPQCGLIQPNLIVILLMIGQVEDKLFDMRRIYSMHGWFGGVLCPDNPTLSGVESQKRQSCPLPENPNKKTFGPRPILWEVRKVWDKGPLLQISLGS